jgi:hypothetical protein
MLSKTTAIELPTGAALERAIAEIESDTHDEQIRQTIIERLKIADEPKITFVSHDKVFSSSRERLMKKLAGKNNG